MLLSLILLIAIFWAFPMVALGLAASVLILLLAWISGLLIEATYRAYYFKSNKRFVLSVASLAVLLFATPVFILGVVVCLIAGGFRAPKIRGY